MKRLVRGKGEPRGAHSFRYLLLALSVKRGAELGPANFRDWTLGSRAGRLPKQRDFRMKLERDFTLLVKEGYGSFEWRVRPGRKGEKFFLPNDRGRLRVYLDEIESVYRLSDEFDRKNIVRQALEVSKKIATDSKSYLSQGLPAVGIGSGFLPCELARSASVRETHPAMDPF